MLFAVDAYPESGPPIASIVALLGVLVVVYIPLALSEGRTLRARAAQGILAALLVLGLGVFFARLEPTRGPVNTPGARLGAAIEAGQFERSPEIAMHWSGRAVGGWLVLLAVSELVRLVLKRTATLEFLAPSALFLAGLLLFEPSWGVAVGFAALILAIVSLAIWRPTLPIEPRSSKSE